MEDTMTSTEKLNELHGLIEKYQLTTLPQTEVARQITKELNADELMDVLDRPAIYDLALLQSIKMTTGEFRGAQKQALYLHLLEEAWKVSSTRN
jgi:hypothetical protein